MGLDMYLYKEKYYSNFSDKESVKHLKELEGFEKSESFMLRSEAIYWRKANAIHNWFVQNVQDGVDECQLSYVRIEDLQNLYDIVSEAIENKDTSLLKTTEGFFFGNTKQDEYYWKELKRTKKELRALLKDPQVNSYGYYYRSSW